MTGLKRTLLLLDNAERQRIEATLAAQKAETDAHDLTESERLAAEKSSREEQARQEQNAESQRRQEAQHLEKKRLAEAKRRERALKMQNARPVPWGRYAAMGAGVVLLLLAFWQVPKWFGSKRNEQISQSDYPMVRVQEGTFMMGSPESEKFRGDGECQHSVTVRAFEIGKYEVTQAQWKAIMGTNPSRFKNCEDCPVEQVSWNDIQTFFEKTQCHHRRKLPPAYRE